MQEENAKMETQNMDVSVLIAARKEPFLTRTVEDVLAKSRANTEVIVVADGYNPDPLPDDSRVKLIKTEDNIGQRAAVNLAAKNASGRYVMKLDAHCMLDEGFDVKLMADCEYDWTVVPRMYQLDVNRWEPKWHKKTDFMFIRSPQAADHPFRLEYYDARTARAFKQEYKAYKEASWRQGDICDTMCCIGACWFLRRDRFWELGGMDENHAHWGQMGIEIACKSWLSGGRLVVNKKTWFAHMWRRSAPWQLDQHTVEKSRRYSMDLWINNKWEKQKLPLDWLVRRFSPVPTWNGHLQTQEQLPKVSDLTLLYYTANVVDVNLGQKVLDQLCYACPDTPIISVSQRAMEIGQNICVGDIGRSLHNIYKQVLIGAREVKTKYVALVEDDCLYVPEHFQHRPSNDNVFAYNLNRWLLHADRENVYSYRKRAILSQCIAPTKLLIECLEQREGKEIPKKYCGEMGLFERKLGLKEYAYETFMTNEPNCVVCHNKNTSGRKTWGKDTPPQGTENPTKSIEPWGNADNLLKTLFDTKAAENAKKSENAEEMETEDMPATSVRSWYRGQHSYLASIIFDINELKEHMLDFADKRRPGRAERRLATLPDFVKRIADNTLPEDFTTHPWFDHLCDLYGGWSYEHRKQRVLQIMNETIAIYADIRDHGLKQPLDMWREGKTKIVFNRGWRRFFIMWELHTRGIRNFAKIPARVASSREAFLKYNPAPDVKHWSAGPVKADSIHGLAQAQFARYGALATDKFWVHGYTHIYDRHFAHLRDKKIKLLELGIFRGASLRLWHDAFKRARIYGVDKNSHGWEKFVTRRQTRIKTFTGRQEDATFLRETVGADGPFDIIIDDAGHRPEQQLAAFEALWPKVAPCGIYVIEDLHGNYWGRKAPTGPLMVDRIKGLFENLFQINDDMQTASITAYYNIAFVEKTR